MVLPAMLVLVAMAMAACTSRPATARHETKSLPEVSSPSTAAPGPATTSQPTTTVPRPDAGAPADVAGSNGGLGEGHWNPAGRPVGGTFALYTTSLRPAGGGPTAGVAWIDTTATKVVLYAGTSEPGGTWPAQGLVAAPDRSRLLATFNSGFKFAASGGGWYANGRVGVALRDGAASLVVHRDGSAGVGQWGRDFTMSPDVTAVRQNLSLLVDNGAPSPTVNAPGPWGATLRNVRFTWRSALGDDGKGHLLFVGGPGLDAAGLASVLVAAGARRAMELDINPQWVIFTSFNDVVFHPGEITAAKLLASMNYPADHFLFPTDRDFVAVFSRSS